jgi:uncharacterized membrane protein YfcA
MGWRSQSGAALSGGGEKTYMFGSIVVGTSIFAIAVVMSMVGRGGGNFYVPILVASGMVMGQAATTAQLILVSTAVAASLIFQKHRTVDWKLALVIDPPTDVMAFVGGFFAHRFGGFALKMVFALLLVLAGFFMLRPVKERGGIGAGRFGFWRRSFGGHDYAVNLWLTLPMTAAVGFVAGMVGISGGSFKIPLMVLLCGVPMRIAVGTSSVMVALTALMGFLGHTAGGDFHPASALPLVGAATVGGIVGGMGSVRVDPRKLKKVFALTTLAAAVFMGFNALVSAA